jgi:hypothetical protein
VLMLALVPLQPLLIAVSGTAAGLVVNSCSGRHRLCLVVMVDGVVGKADVVDVLAGTVGAPPQVLHVVGQSAWHAQAPHACVGKGQVSKRGR